MNNSETHYTANRGILPLRTAISEHLEKLYDVSYDPQDEVVATVGGSEALLLAISALLNPGDEVLLPTHPCFVSYQGIILLAGGAFRWKCPAAWRIILCRTSRNWKRPSRPRPKPS